MMQYADDGIAISIHAPRGRGDLRFIEDETVFKDFNPRPSREGRRTDRVLKAIRR